MSGCQVSLPDLDGPLSPGIFRCPLPVYPLPKSNHYSGDFYHHRLVLPVLELHVHGISQQVLFCAYLLSFNVICVDSFMSLCKPQFVLFMQWQYSLVGIRCNLFIYSEDRHLACFQCLTTMNKAPINIFECVFLFTREFISLG